MSDVKKNPQTEPQDTEYDYRFFDRGDYPTTIGGPGGKSTLTENNEKGILEENVFHVLSIHKQAELEARHQESRQGVYSQTTTYGD